MKRLFFLLLALPVLAVQAQMMPPLPQDEAVRIGKLDNGLTYYIRHNELPKDRANFYIAQRVGSVQEEESQRGLAHFLEHMCFNGTTHFPGNSLIEYLQGIGIQFGGELNAYTSTDETVYNIDNVPVTPGHIDSCLLILHDWSNSLLLEADEIDKERGVIHEEWRLRSSAIMRIFERNLETIFPGSRYGRRFPIGLMSVVDGFAYDTLRAYYHKWYRPDLQGIVVVGDIDVDQVEKKIKTIFSTLKNPENEAPYVDYPVPSTPQPIYIIDKDKEQAQIIYQILYKHEPMPREVRNTAATLAMDYMNSVIQTALNARLNELSQKPDCPFGGAFVFDGKMLGLTKTMDAFTLYLLPKPGQDAAAMQCAMQEMERVHRFGLTNTEVIRAREEFLSAREAQYNNRNKQQNSYYVNRYVRAFLDGTPTSSIETDYNTYQMLAPNIPAEVINEVVKEYVASTDSNFVVLGCYPDKEDIVVPTVDEIKAAVAAAKAAQLEAYVDNVRNEPLIAQLPAPGKIVKESESKFGYKKWELSNGANVYFKKTDFDESQVKMSAHSWGGLWAVAPADVLNAGTMPSIINTTGLGNFKQTELEKALAGKQASVSVSLTETAEGMSGTSTPKDLATLFELIYLYFTAPGNDVDSYNSTLNLLRLSLENTDKVPETALRDSIVSTIYQNHPFVKPLKVADLDKLNYDAMRRIYQERFKSAGDFDFYFTGAFDEANLRQYVEQYIASLPAAAKREAKPTKTVEAFKGVVTNRFERKMETPKGYIVQVWHGDEPFTLKDEAVVDVLGQILSQRYLKSIREEGSMAYSVQAMAELEAGVKPEYTMQIICPVKPAKVDSALILIKQGIDEIGKGGVTQKELDKATGYNVKSYMDAQKKNSYWEGLIRAYNNWGIDKRSDYEKVQKSVTSADIQKFVNTKLLKQNNCATVVMLPDDFTE